MEKAVKILIYIHAGFGGISLLAGLISLCVKKGGDIHKKAGLVFYYAMIMTGITAFIVASMPNHHSPFLIAIGVFSLYFVITGYRAMRFKHKNPDLKVDKLISWIMIVVGVLMIFLPLLFSNSLNIVLTVFAAVGIILSVRDLRLFKNPEQLRKSWLKLHLSKMLGGYISASTAFVVVNSLFPSFYGWFIPGIIGGVVITYWIRKLDGKKKVVNN